MSTNISKKKRDDLLDKIKQIRAFIAAAPQDENTGNLLSYLSDLEKDVNGKKYGLVFEEHREEIDEVLDTHTPVLTEDKDLFIDNGGQMNFLIEGDNLASLVSVDKGKHGFGGQKCAHTSSKSLTIQQVFSAAFSSSGHISAPSKLLRT